MHEESDSSPRTSPGPYAEVLERLAGRRGSFARYRVEEEIAQGGQGVVMRVWDEDLRRSLAMKVLHDTTEAVQGGANLEAHSLGRFLEEAQVTGQLDHPGIVPIHELGLDARGQVYFTMKLVKGRTLKEVFELVARGEDGWTRARALAVFLRVCEAMAYAHHKGVVHRDLKPANVMIGRFGEVYVMDWGLARVLGSADHKNVRVAPLPLTVELVTERNERARAEPDSPLVTMDGHVVGTPVYMSPEQARGELDEIGPWSDVYSVGAMLYHLLAGQMPYMKPGMRLSNYAVWYRVQEGPPDPIAERARDAPAELQAICVKAMARERRARYADMGELAADLTAFLEHRAVAAFDTGAFVELRKWVERNRGLAASFAVAFVALVAGLSASLVFKERSDRSAVLARESERVATERADDILRLSALQRLDDLTAEASRLWPAHPGNLARYDDWLREAEALLAELPDHRAKLAELEARGVALPPDERAPGVALPDREELERTKRYRQYRRDLRATLDVPGAHTDPTPQDVLDPTHLPASADAVNYLAWRLVDPDRKDWGAEARGLALARRAVELAQAQTPESSAHIRDTLAWALFACGEFDEAVLESERTVEEAAPDARQALQAARERMLAMIEAELDPAGEEQRAARMLELDRRIARLEKEIPPLTEWRFADAQDRWWHSQLAKLVSGLEALADPERGLAGAGVSAEHGWSIQRRAEFARTVEERSRSGSEAEARWRAAMTSIASAVECPRYAGLELLPQVGLLPLGRDPDSGLWEFAHLQSGEPAERGPDGKLVLEDETGLVFVLLPGGTFEMGAQATDAGARNHDPQARVNEGPLRTVTLAPYFLSKYEMTQGQWERFSGENPSNYGPNTAFGGQRTTLLSPVEQVSWTDATERLARLGLELPTEEQWEYAARAGTDSAWWTGDDVRSLAGAANLADSFCLRNGGPVGLAIEEWLDDGHTVHAPVGSFAANPFGLHDVCGNVWEWCRGRYEDYWGLDPFGAGEGDTGGSSNRTLRGGSFANLANEGRSSSRAEYTPEFRSESSGLRPALELTY